MKGYTAARKSPSILKSLTDLNKAEFNRYRILNSNYLFP